MPTDPAPQASDPTQVHPTLTLDQARATLADALVGAGLEGAGTGDPVDVRGSGPGGLSFQLALNGATIALAGQDKTMLGADELQPFLETQRRAIEGGEYDAAIERAIATPGPGKATARVRAAGAAGGFD